jgi:hypothetical protein
MKNGRAMRITISTAMTMAIIFRARFIRQVLRDGRFDVLDDRY